MKYPTHPGIVTFNCASPLTVRSKNYNGYDESLLDSRYRLNELKRLFSFNMRTYPIFALQEVPDKWKSIFNKYFQNNNYTFYCKTYGGIFGVGIAVPNFYGVQDSDVEYFKVSDYIRVNAPDVIVEKLCGLDQSDIDKIISNAKNRENILIRVKIRVNETQSFYLYNYHMPCAYKLPIIQIMHIHALKHIFSEHASDDLPYIIAADMNILPDSDSYNFMTKNELTDEHSAYFMKTMSTNISTDHILRSSYKEVNLYEPEFTCFSDTVFGGKFKGCLDYIMISSKIKTLRSHMLIKTENKLPNKDCPSDHLPLRSVFLLL